VVAPALRRRALQLICFLTLIAAWTLDMFSPQLFVVAILLSVPIALSSLTLNQRFTFQLIVVALIANASAGWFNAYQEHFRWQPIAVGDRLLAGLSILLVGTLTIKAQQAAQRSGELAERHARSEVMRDLIYALSHDLRTPLAAAGMTMRQALNGSYGRLPPQYRDILGRQIAANEELNRLAETLLLVARYESGDQSERRETVNLNSVARSVIEELRPLWEFKEIRAAFESDLEQIYISGDETEIKRAITNLVANAVAWTPAGGTIVLRVDRSSKNVALSVEDNGYGVPPAARASLFERFVGHSRQGGGSRSGLQRESTFGDRRRKETRWRCDRPGNANR